jgi:hypothetical protein
MGYENSEKGERLSGNKPVRMPQTMTLQKAIELGEYDPAYLSTFPEWHTLSRHIQFEFIRSGLENRNKQLLTQWAEINNILDFHLKPHLKEALTNIEKQWKKLDKDKEKLYAEYSV